MAIGDVQLTRKSVVLAKLETAKGVDASPGAADGILVSDLSITVNGNILTRAFLRDTISPQGHIIGAKDVELSFSTEIKSSGTSNVGGAGDAAQIDPLLRAAGLKRTDTAEASPGAGDGNITYDPISSSFESASVYAFWDGLRIKVLGAQTNLEIDLLAGEFGRFIWTVRGEYQRPTDNAAPASITYDTQDPPVIQSLAFTMGVSSLIAQQLNLNLNNEFAVRPDLNAVDGVRDIRITARNTGGSFNPETEKEADFAFFSRWENATLNALTATVGATGGNIFQATAPNALFESVTPGDREGIRIYDIPLRLATSTETALDDEIKLIFK